MEKRLGRGLGALISTQNSKDNQKEGTIKLKEIIPNPFQPRKNFNDEKMQELISSIKEKGILQPVIVRTADAGYELIAGERRLRAAQALNLEEIPAIIRDDIDDASSLEISIIENIQREELNPIEEATAYRELIDQFEYTLDKVGQMVGKDKTTVSNSLRLLTLSRKIKEYIEEGKITTGHAKALLSINSDYKKEKIAKMIISEGLSVRATEQIANRITAPKIRIKKVKSSEISTIEESLQHKLGTKVLINHGKKRGKIEIQYFSEKDLQRIISLLLEG
ncbi:MAG: ParB/RepB/Spo0J family partition protein [Candidatus Omnitrophota bacterium]